MISRTAVFAYVLTIVTLGVLGAYAVVSAATWDPTPGANAYANTEFIEATLTGGEPAACAGLGDGEWGLRFSDGSNWYNSSAVDCAQTTASWAPGDFIQDGGSNVPDYGIAITDVSVAAYSGGQPNSTMDSDSSPSGIWDYDAPGGPTYSGGSTTTLTYVSWPAGEAWLFVAWFCLLFSIGWRIMTKKV